MAEVQSLLAAISMAAIALVLLHAILVTRREVRRTLRHARRRLNQSAAKWQRLLVMLVTLGWVLIQAGPPIFYCGELLGRTVGVALHAV
jgi:uncharacterized membrane protein